MTAEAALLKTHEMQKAVLFSLIMARRRLVPTTAGFGTSSITAGSELKTLRTDKFDMRSIKVRLKLPKLSLSLKSGQLYNASLEGKSNQKQLTGTRQSNQQI